MRSIERLCSKEDRQRAVDAWAAAASGGGGPPDAVWHAACAQAGRTAGALVRGAVALGEVPVARAALFSDTALAAAGAPGAPCRVLGTVLEAAAALARTDAAGVGPAPAARARLREALRALPLDLADPLECAALAEAHFLYARAFLRPTGPTGPARRRHLQLAAACGVPEATSLLLADVAAMATPDPTSSRSSLSMSSSSSSAPAVTLAPTIVTAVALPPGVANVALFATHPLTLALARATEVEAASSASESGVLHLLCTGRQVSRLFYHCASLVLEQRGLFVAPACPLARPRHAARTPPDPASPLAALVATRAWGRLVVALDRDTLVALRATARWVRDAVDALPRVRLALAHWQAAAAFAAHPSLQNAQQQQQQQQQHGVQQQQQQVVPTKSESIVKRAAHAGGVAASSLVALLTGHDAGDGRDSPSAAARCTYYAGSAVSLLVLSPLLAVSDACSLLTGARAQTQPQQGLLRGRAWEVSSTRCALCNAVFGLVARRHHCRCCRRPICARCSRFLALPPSPLRTFLARTSLGPAASPSGAPANTLGASSRPDDAPARPERFCAACAPSLELGHLPPDHPLLAVW